MAKKNNQDEQLPDPMSILEAFGILVDPRVERTRAHPLISIVTIALCCILSAGGETFVDMADFGEAKKKWFQSFLPLPSGIPSHDTFNRVFQALNPQCFLECFQRWVLGLQGITKGVIAIDGKSLRRAGANGEKLPHIVSAWASEAGLTLGQIKCDDKSNEITAIPELLRTLHLEGAIVTIDAMGCQKAIAKQIVEAKADYVLALKGNQAMAHDEFKTFFDDLVKPGTALDPQGILPDNMDLFESTDKGHGRIEIRRTYQSADIDWFADKALWQGLRSVVMIESERIIGEKKTSERRYYISSLPLDARKAGKSIRDHWGIENPLHWVLDVVFGEDNARARSKNAAQNLASLRRLALNIIKQHPTARKTSIRGRRNLAAWDNNYLATLLGI